MIHRITLSNGQVLIIEEGPQTLHIASGIPGEEEADAWICTITADGVLVMPNSGGATDDLTRGLGK